MTQLDESQVQEQFESFYEDIFTELSKFGEVDEINVCDNLGDHMVGNVYVKFVKEEDAQTAMAALQGRFYAGKQLTAEFSPVTDFREARCRQYYTGECTRGGFCHFMHLKKVSPELKRDLYRLQRKERSHSRSRSRSRSKSRSRSSSRSKGHHHRRHSHHHKHGHHRHPHSKKSRSRSRSKSRSRSRSPRQGSAQAAPAQEMNRPQADAGYVQPPPQ